jgi:hypothetical protein
MNVDNLKIRETEKWSAGKLPRWPWTTVAPFSFQMSGLHFLSPYLFEFQDDGEPRNSGQEIKVTSVRQTEPNPG